MDEVSSDALAEKLEALAREAGDRYRQHRNDYWGGYSDGITASVKAIVDALQADNPGFDSDKFLYLVAGK